MGMGLKWRKKQAVKSYESFPTLRLSEPNKIQPRVFQADLSSLRPDDPHLQEHMEKEWILEAWKRPNPWPSVGLSSSGKSF